jgi:microcompartment protein CcmK/EutM
VDSEAEAEAGVSVPLAQDRETVTLAALFGTKSFWTVKLAAFKRLTIVQDPADRAAEQVPVEPYPAGIGDSVAVQVGSPTKPVTVKTAGVDSEADADAGVSDPLAQDRLTVTLAGLLSEKSLFTVNVAVLRVFVIMHDPADSAAAHVPLDVYPAGTGDSVAVHSGSPTKPVTVKDAGVDSEALAVAGVSLPLAQERLTLTLAALFGTKSLLTLKVAVFSELTIVQLAVPPSTIERLTQPAWFAV